MSETVSKKRKREADPPRVTFVAPNRTFERLLKESSLGDLRSAVAKKLGLSAATSLELSQIRGGKSIDLEDEDDFEAFKSYATSNGVAEVGVSVFNALSQRTHDSGVAQVTSTVAASSSTGKSQVTPSLGVMSPVSQPNGSGSSDSNNALSTLQDQTSQSKSKKDEQARQSEAGPSTVASVELSMADAPNIPEAATATKKKKPQPSKAAKETSSADKQSRKGVRIVSSPDATSFEKSVANPPEKEPTTAAKSTKQPKRNSEEKKSDKTNKQADAIAESATNPPPADVPPAGPSRVLIPLTQLPVPETPSREQKKQPKSKEQKAPAAAETAVDSSDAHEQPVQKPRTPALPSGKDASEKESAKVQPENPKPVAAPRQDAQKSKKRKPEPEDKTGAEAITAKETKKPKKRKTHDSNAPTAMASPSTTEANTAATSAQKDTTVSAPPKSSAKSKKKKTKATAEELSQYDADLDNAVANVLAKRVSESSKQTGSTAPMTAPASSVPNKELNEKRLTEKDKDEVSTSKPKRRKKPLNRKNVVITDTESMFEGDSNVAKGTVAREITTAANDMEPNLLAGTRNNRVSSKQLDEVENGGRASTKTVELLDNRDNVPGSKLPTFNDVNARGESVATDGVADSVVNHVMEQDATLFLSGLNKPSRISPETNLSTTSRHRVAREKPPLSSNESANDIDDEESASVTSKESEERDPTPLPHTPRARQPAPQTISDNANPGLRRSVQASSRSQLEVSRPGTPGMVARMKGRGRGDVEAKEVPSPSPTSELALGREDPVTRSMASETPAAPQDFDTSTLLGKRHQPAARHPTGSQPSNSSKSNPARQRKNVTPAGSHSGEEAIVRKQSRSEAVSRTSQKEDGKTPLTAGLPTTGSTATKVTRENDTSAQVTTVEDPETQTAPDIPISALVNQGEDGVHIESDSNSGSTTEVDRSVDGAKGIVEDSIILPSLRSRKSASPEQHPLSGSWVIDPSDSEEDDEEEDSDDQPLVKRALSKNTSRLSLISAPRLSDIASRASRRDLFSPASTPRPSLALSSVQKLGSQMPSGGADNGSDDDDEEDSSSSSSSESDSEHESHIPEEKRAGHTTSQSKTSGVLKSWLPFLHSSA